jgi:hypothetical protein
VRVITLAEMVAEHTGVVPNSATVAFVFDGPLLGVPPLPLPPCWGAAPSVAARK